MADPLLSIKPSKPVSQMTDEEREAFANALFDGITARHGVAKDIPQPDNPDE